MRAADEGIGSRRARELDRMWLNLLQTGALRAVE
jgi:hypothetical protein